MSGSSSNTSPWHLNKVLHRVSMEMAHPTSWKHIISMDRIEARQIPFMVSTKYIQSGILIYLHFSLVVRGGQ